MSLLINETKKLSTKPNSELTTSYAHVTVTFGENVGGKKAWKEKGRCELVPLRGLNYEIMLINSNG